MSLTKWAKASVLALTAMSAVAHADVVSDWAEFADAIGTEAGKTRTGYDAATAQDGTKVALAMFEAADAVDRRYKSWVGLPAAPRGASLDLAVATAAHDVLVASYPGQKAAIEQRYTLALASVKNNSGRESGIAAGHDAAAAALKSGGIDPNAPKVPAAWGTTATPGSWGPTAASVVEPAMLTVRPWFMKSVSQFRPQAPVALNSERWHLDLDEVRRMGSKTSSERTAADTVLASFWISTDDMPALRAVASQPGRTPVQNARFYALFAMADDDVSLVLVDSKLHYAFWRPISALRAGSGGIPSDPAWEPLLRTPMHPEYLCGHCAGAAVLAEVIDEEGKFPAGGLPFVGRTLPGFTVSVPSTADYVRQMNNARIHGGVHYRSTAETTERVARAMVRYASANFAQPIR